MSSLSLVVFADRCFTWVNDKWCRTALESGRGNVAQLGCSGPLLGPIAIQVRPAISLADAVRGDWMLCQVTRSPCGEPMAISIGATNFASGGLLVASIARQSKLYTVDSGRVLKSVGGRSPAAEFSMALSPCFRGHRTLISRSLRKYELCARSTPLGTHEIPIASPFRSRPRSAPEGRLGSRLKRSVDANGRHRNVPLSTRVAYQDERRPVIGVFVRPRRTVWESGPHSPQ